MTVITTALGAHSGFTLPDGDGIKQQVKARAYVGSNQNITASTPVKVNYDTESYDTGGDFDTANKKFVVPTTGFYLINAVVHFNSNSDGNKLVVTIKNNSTVIARTEVDAGGPFDNTVSCLTIASLAAAVEVTVEAENATANDTISGGGDFSYFEIFFLST